MPEFIFAFHGGKAPESPEEGAKLMARWQVWLDGLGDSLVNPGNPVGMSKTVSAAGIADNGGPDPLAGFSFVRAADINAATALCAGCPHLEHGTIEVAEVKSM